MSNINVNNLTPLLGSGSSVSVSGSLVVKNDVTIGGHLYIGDENTDSVTFSAEVSSSIIPDANITYDLGSSAKKWSSMYLDSLVVNHITASGNISASGTGSFTQGLIVEGSSSLAYVSASGDISSSGTGSFAGGIEADEATGSFGYISASGDISTSADIYGKTGSFEGGIDCIGDGKNATGSFGYISASEDISSSGDIYGHTGSFNYVKSAGDISSSASGSFMDVFVDDNVEIQGAINLHGNISSSNTSTGSFGYISASGDVSSSGTGSFFGGVDAAGATGSFGYISASGTISGASLNVTGEISASYVSASGGFEADTASTSTFGTISASGNISSSGRISASGGFEADAGTVSNFGTVSASNGIRSDGDISGSSGLVGNTLQMEHNGINTLTVTNAGAVSASSTIQGTAFTAQTNGTNAFSISAAGAMSASSTLAGTALTLATSGDTKATIDASGNISGAGAIEGNSFSLTNSGDNVFSVTNAGALSASSTLAGTALTVSTTGTTYASIDALGTGSFLGGIDCIGDGKEATGSFGYISMSGANADISGATNIYILGGIYGPGNKAVLEASATNQTLGNSGLIVDVGGTQLNLNATADGLTITGSISASHNFNSEGTGSFTGGVFADSDISSSGIVYAYGYENAHYVTNAQTLTTTSSGVPIIVTGTSTVTLPDAAEGHSWWVINGNIDGVGITVSPHSSDAFIINAAGASGVDDKDLINTAGTAHRGDYVKLTASSTNNKIVILERAGVWADES